MDASPMAKGYYKLPDNAKWVDTLKCMVCHTTIHPMLIPGMSTSLMNVNKPDYKHILITLDG
jgi:hypothetical protein